MSHFGWDSLILVLRIFSGNQNRLDQIRSCFLKKINIVWEVLQHSALLCSVTAVHLDMHVPFSIAGH